MTLPVRERRALDRIQKALHEGDSQLGPMFGVFTALTRHEAVPQTEQVRKDLWKRLRRRAASPIAVIATLRVLLLSWLGPGRHGRGVTSAAPGHRGT
jgi:hypothetical protein